MSLAETLHKTIELTVDDVLDLNRILNPQEDLEDLLEKIYGVMYQGCIIVAQKVPNEYFYEINIYLEPEY